MAEPEWVKEAQAALHRLGPPHEEKKKATIIALVDARLAGRSEESVWKLPEVCNRNTYHMKWKKDPVFAGVLDEVDRLARGWKDNRALRALNQAAERLAVASPAAAMAAIRMLEADDMAVRLRAAFGILDRAGFQTAAKGQQAITGAGGEKLFPVDELVAALKAIDLEKETADEREQTSH